MKLELERQEQEHLQDVDDLIFEQDDWQLVSQR